MTVHFCVASRDDPAYETIVKVVAAYPKRDARIFVESEDQVLNELSSNNDASQMGPNPKIRNMSRAYREAKGDIMWIVDCNVWVGRGACGRMVDTLCGYSEQGEERPCKLVHLLPLAVDVDVDVSMAGMENGHASTTYDDASTLPLLDGDHQNTTISRTSLGQRGGRLEELFLSSSHAKMYVAINVVAVAPCIVGKSTMFRRSHLNYLTSNTESGNAPILISDPYPYPTKTRTVGIDFFSHNICEDHLIGDLLWKSKLPQPPRLRNHGLVLGDLAIQPVAGMTVANYVARRVRWLRVRKFTVPVATLVEPGTESFLCSLYGAFGFTTSKYTRDIFGSSWTTFGLLWILSISIWAAVDWTVYLLLHSGRTIEPSDAIAPFAQPLKRTSRRPFLHWLAAWLGREALALPIWTWAIWGGTTVVWRDRKFWVGMDMKVHEIEDLKNTSMNGNGHVGHGKSRTD